MALNLDDLAVFVRTAQTGSLSEAARQLGLSPQIASRRLAALERSLGARLLHRNTRRASPTVDGEALLPAAERLLHDADAAASLVGTAAVSPSGLLRVTAPVSFGLKVMMPVVTELVRRFPALRIDLQLSDALVDLIESGIDLAIRISPPRESQLVGRRLASNPLHLVAAPTYVADKGAPRRLADLARHACLTRTGSDVWTFAQSAKERQLRVHGPFCSSLNEALRQAAVDGLGIGLHSQWDIGDLTKAGRLIEIHLEDARPRSLEVWALWPHGRLAAVPRVRVFVDQLAAMMTTTGCIDNALE